jgi:hypothetical protein
VDVVRGHQRPGDGGCESGPADRPVLILAGRRRCRRVLVPGRRQVQPQAGCPPAMTVRRTGRPDVGHIGPPNRCRRRVGTRPCRAQAPGPAGRRRGREPA